jgi:hypothetical protein
LIQIAPNNSGSQATANIAPGVLFTQGVERDISNAMGACRGG